MLSLIKKILSNIYTEIPREHEIKHKIFMLEDRLRDYNIDYIYNLELYVIYKDSYTYIEIIKYINSLDWNDHLKDLEVKYDSYFNIKLHYFLIHDEYYLGKNSLVELLQVIDIFMLKYKELEKKNDIVSRLNTRKLLPYKTNFSRIVDTLYDELF